MTADASHLLAHPALADLLPHEAEAVAELLRPRRYAAGRTVIAAGAVPTTLHFVTHGYALGADGARWPEVFDAAAVLLGLPCEGCTAGPEGLETLTLARPYLFTLTREFPSLLRRLPVVGAP